ncbi:BZIP domain-containing protein [Caenorhabditis elegans]|uniref:BZIP domain-containing protein n=1 Tax=Caenorhabditis elegans TaxID=6239 RepID=O44802_CAEEL|nr:BZIP domain-containing protein [Caenorhabditis elegans]CCD69494.1 BZIP domain-containing protein [Caenorhabditis elegans]|eukprot:NP_494510.2 Uncharacterized protein CELE_F14D2.5 [Caenorhabditis elegans]
MFETAQKRRDRRNAAHMNEVMRQRRLDREAAARQGLPLAPLKSSSSTGASGSSSDRSSLANLDALAHPSTR